MRNPATTTKPPPWAAAYPDHLDWRMDPLERPVYHLLDDAAAHDPGGVCMDFLDRLYSFADILDLANRTARGLQQLGLKKGQRVGICLPNSPYYLAAYFGALKAGATVVNFNPLYSGTEIRAQIIDSGVEIMFTLGLKKLYPKVADALSGTSLRTIVVCSLGDALPPVKSFLWQVFKRGEIAEVPENLQNLPFDWLTRNPGHFTPVPIDPRLDIALFQYTGGTTGTPKAAMLTHANITTNTEQVYRWLPDAPPGAPGGESILAVLPFFHVFAMTVTMCLALRLGGKIIALPRFDLDQVLKVIHTKRPTLFPAIPTIYAAITSQPHLERYDLTSIRYCLSGGAPLSEATKKAFEHLTGCTLVEGYGLSETSPVACCNPVWSPRRTEKPGSIGIPLPGTQIEIRDPDPPHHRVATGQRGEVVIKGPQVMVGYWNKADETRAVLKDGWLRTGDIGHMDGDGYVFLTDRIKDVIICNGFKVYPRIIEDALQNHPDVHQVAVIAIPDPLRGEVPKAFVVRVAGSSLDAEALTSFASQTLNPKEQPQEIEFRDTLPTTLIGKVSKKDLIAEDAAKRAAVERHHG